MGDDVAPHALPDAPSRGTPVSPPSPGRADPNLLSSPLLASAGSAASVAKLPPRRKHYAIGGGKQITRTRVSYSCHTCRRRKVKCDKVHPVCSNCQKNGSECAYDSRSLTHRTRVSQDHHHQHQNRLKRRRERLPETSLADLLSPYTGLQLPHDAGEHKSGSEQIAARLDRLTSMIERLSRTNGSLTPQDSEPIFQGMRSLYEASELSLRHATRPASGPPSRPLSRQSSPRRQSTGGSNHEDFPMPTGLSTDLVDPVGTLNLGHLSLEDGGKSRYVGTTYWAYISDEINELNQLLRDQNRSQQQAPTSPELSWDAPSEISHPPSGQYNLEGSQRMLFRDESAQNADPFLRDDSPLSADRPIQAEMLENVPSRRQSNILYKGFMSGIHAISPVVHPPTVLRLYQYFWEWYDSRGVSRNPYPDPAFIPLLYAIWYGGSVTISLRTIHAEFDVGSRAHLSGPFHDEVTRWLKKITFPRNPTLHGLAAFLLVQTILSKEEEPLTSSLFISLALRVAQTMGLHRDPAQFGILACEAETRRRVWWHIVHMDGVVAMSSGLPPLVSDDNYWDVRIASDVKDTLIGTPEALEYERAIAESRRNPDRPNDPNVCGNSMVNVYYICAKGKYVMARAIRKILRIQLGTKPVTRKDMEDLRSILMDLQADLRGLVDRIPIPKVDAGQPDPKYPPASAGNKSIKADLPNGGPGCHEQYHTSVLAAFHKWARILLSLFVDKAFCVAYQPFLKNAKSKIWPAARQCALHHCHGFMEKFISLATDPDFQPFQWSWPGNHQPMHATMIMLIDLYERPGTPEAPISRAFIDKIFSLSGPDGGVVGGEDGISTARPLKDGGREAWDMMRRLREKAWQKAGLDPKVLWTEQAQAAIPPSNSKEQTSSPENFADSYFAMIKKPYENHKPLQRRSTEREVAKEPLRSENSTVGDMPHVKAESWAVSLSSPNSQLAGPSTMWNCSPSLSEIAAFNPEYKAPQGGDASGFFGGSNQFCHSNNISQAPQGIPSAEYQGEHSFSSGQTIVPFSSGPAGQSRVDPNHNFDWDQWDAVFGQYLPVVEGMDLDTPAESHGGQGHGRDVRMSRMPFMGAELGLDETVNSGDKMRNWADFG
ncbi:hypothetical protein LOZ39_005584 [Ophidiomyces ophidiicola]|nr:hypothetical protein LOZ49_004190 [Ophidiomyces ophidiicola]KAI2068878.1 hypothetical protein LOZ39_005584 [Ophidiomyces ophidiicola]KAI2140055.1 hypothetical protein LOZ28_002994 [Ophidiomyces ophidiicola]KAI2443879.1 hypothetical protein LOZ08_002294 [Ophidiomyces ophidiicola]KAI2457057.1 hypothetical protein LOY97_005119 [Ophidiomyces ophidiicola]